ncbi:MAG: metal-sensitive transcriptional regulator [Lactococcus raffinolactis]|jgi:DNA-binding FrmR family transcriptional regulator|uniref:Metal-sensing transcriptional repressor n=1 Tax=Pseudolactococcus raffinolactis TaxID=1366 RepID=A0A290Q1M4_9LACT|nr:metal-sensitive transcriptional regulator [Lactococcus raffinolactis]MBR3055019.1 metal-sensitive transcriptional regulator [Streptococcus sp.]ATC62237.1 hypothetical protein CMV25_10360 [Lactococcus raffinolactis]MBW9297351.1 metal-sensitive transcriptional regulator [Lactococcus raffinolactis]MBW9330071.1 metal-sensitive transcriptional regulator [Lactococcus raffinolactis]MCH4161564.1 metal-sensitive transcriptional regulator [Lactococcus raffinolactis]
MLESDNQKQIINRLRRVEGQLRGIQKMIAEEKDCVNIVTQLSAVRSGIDRTMGIIVAENLKQCFEHPNDNPEEQLEKMEQAIQMVIKK